jgi:peptide deformylase
MTILEVRLYGDPVLREKCREVKEVNDQIKELLDNMADTMYHNKGVGLAAPQVGIPKRVIVVDAGEGLTTLVNPRVLQCQGEAINAEGCLSLPGIVLDVRRAQEVVVEGLDRDGKPRRIKADGLYARVLQHEIDHLNGALITNHVSRKKLKTIRKQLKNLEEKKEC